MKKPTKSDIIKAVNLSKSAEILALNPVTDRALTMKMLQDAITHRYTVIILK